MVFIDKCSAKSSDFSLKSSVLSIDQLEFDVHLGWPEEERRLPQPVSIDLKLQFKDLPSGCKSDLLEGTQCYSQMADRIREVCAAQEYKLIEHLTWKIYSALRTEIPSQVSLWVALKKVKVPIQELRGGATFSLGDWEP